MKHIGTDKEDQGNDFYEEELTFGNDEEGENNAADNQEG